MYQSTVPYLAGAEGLEPTTLGFGEATSSSRNVNGDKSFGDFALTSRRPTDDGLLKSAHEQALLLSSVRNVIPQAHPNDEKIGKNGETNGGLKRGKWRHNGRHNRNIVPKSPNPQFEK